MRYEESLPHEIESQIDRMPVAYLPWGAIEWHGAHNPVGLDGVKAEFLARELAREIGGVVLPGVFCGHYPTAGLSFPCSLDFSKETVEGIARDYLRELPKVGFKLVVIVAGHWPGPHIDAIRAVAEEFNAGDSGAKAWVVQDNEMTDAPGAPEDHGGAMETSYIMAAVPGRVDFSQLPDGDLSFHENGVMGNDPRVGASEEHGREMAALYVREAAKRIRELLSIAY